MERFHVVAKEVGVRVAGVVDWLCGCAHRRTTFPITLRAGSTGHASQSTQMETYIACLDCGRRFPYDWATMQVAKRRLAWGPPPPLLPALHQSGRGWR